jgi:hypothetical protein
MRRVIPVASRKGLVVAHHQQRPVIGAKPGLDRLYRIDVEMVRGFVEDQERQAESRAAQYAGQAGAQRLAAAQAFRHDLQGRIGAELEAGEHGAAGILVGLPGFRLQEVVADRQSEASSRLTCWSSNAKPRAHVLTLPERWRELAGDRATSSVVLPEPFGSGKSHALGPRHCEGEADR